MFARHSKRITSSIAALAAATSLSACAYMDIGNGGMTDGEPLSSLDMGGPAPDSIALVGPDDVVITEGDALDIAIDGDSEATESMRFKIDDGELKIGREESWSDEGSKAVVLVTMPAPREISLAGSGNISSPTTAKNAEINIAGSGSVEIATVEANLLEVDIAGSGDVEAAGKADRLEVDMAGSGNVRMRELMADRVEVAMAGSGDVEVSSDGTVEASIAGSGDVVVRGNAECSLSSLGSGSLICEPTKSEEVPALAEDE